MEIILFFTILISAMVNIILFIKLENIKKTRVRAEFEKSKLEERLSLAQIKSENDSKKINLLESQHSELLIFRGRFEESQKNLTLLNLQIEKNKSEINSYKNQLNDFEKRNSLMAQEKENLKLEKEEWSSKKQAILFQLSEELIKKNNAQQDNFGKKQKRGYRANNS